jgi:hypothetical protein
MTEPDAWMKQRDVWQAVDAMEATGPDQEAPA